MTKRTRRLAGCFGTLLVLSLLLVLMNTALGMYFRHQGTVVAREMSAKGYPATFEELMAMQNSGSAIERDAVTDILAAFAAFEDRDINYDLTPVSTACELPPAGEPIPPEILAEMEKFVSMNRDILARLKSAVAAGPQHLPIHSAIDWNHDFIDCALGLRNCSRLLLVEAVYLAEKGDADAALDSLDTLVRLSDFFASQPSEMAYLVSTAGMAQAAAEDLIERGHPKDRAQLERLIAIMDFEGKRNPAFASWTEALLSEQRVYASPIPKTIFQDVLGAIHPWETFNDFVLPHVIPYTFLNDADHYYEKRVALLLSDSLDEPLLTGIERMDGASSTGMFSSLYRWRTSAVISESLPSIEGLYRARSRTAATAVRVVLYQNDKGRLPEPAVFEAEIKPPNDPFDGKPLRYRKTDTGFVIYSVGRNGVDDGGAGLFDRRGADDEAVEIRLPQ